MRYFYSSVKNHIFRSYATAAEVVQGQTEGGGVPIITLMLSILQRVALPGGQGVVRRVPCSTKGQKGHGAVAYVRVYYVLLLLL